MKQGYFITGTGTGVGKTYVTCSLAARARELGQRVFAFKPIETGCERQGGRLVGSDQRALVAAAGGWQTEKLAGLYQFDMPVAPAVAAAETNQTIEVAPIIGLIESTAPNVDLVLVEGAGGWRVPITAEVDMAQLAASCRFPVVIAAMASLGTINHSLLTIEAVERDGQTVAALVLSMRHEDDRSLVASNVEEIGRRWPGRILVLAVDGSVLDPLL